MNSRHRFRLTPLLILLLAAALRFHALARDVRFHPDEALFASFARSAAVQGDWLLHGVLDKPPLTIYADALAMTFFGITPLPNGVLTLGVHAGEFAARVPATFASILLVAVVYALAKRVYSDQLKDRNQKTRHFSLSTAVLAMLLTALSPYALAFSATAFTDGMMLLFITLALWAASRGKALEAGVGLALGFWCKQQAVFYVPLVLAIVWSVQSSVVRRQSKAGSGLHFKLIPHSSFLIPLVPLAGGIALLFAWDAARGQTSSLWALAVANNDPGHLARLDELLPRLSLWWTYAQYLFGTGILTILFTLVAVIYPIYRLLRKDKTGRVPADVILLAYVVLYFLVNWLIAFNIYDRYLLLILPPLWLLTARGISELLEWVSERAKRASHLHNIFAPLLLCAFALMLFSIHVANGNLPIGGDHGENEGIEQLGAYLDSKPLGTIIYDHWLGWELGYYLGTWSDKRRTYYPTPQALVADARLQPDPAPRYLVAPADAPVQPWLDALRNGGFAVSLVHDQPPFVVYEIIPPRRVGYVSAVESSWPGQIERFADSCG